MSWVLFFDGDCAICSKSMRLVARLDKRERIAFAPLQGDLARKSGLSHHAVENGGTMVILRESDGRIFVESDAAIELARAMGGGWSLFAAARWVPKCIRDPLYRWIARNRFRWFGKADSCEISDPDLQKRLRN